MSQTNQICVKCLLTDTTPSIYFDESGVCNYCRTYVPMEIKPNENFIEILNKFRNKGKKYDCMVGLSGGRDSTYILWKLCKDYNLKVITVTYDNPFTSEQAKQNIKNTLDILDIDHVHWSFPNDVHLKSTQKHLKIWSHYPSSTMISYVCAYCKTWWPGYFKAARENDVSLVIIGSNPLETAAFKQAGFGGARKYHELSNVPKIILKSLKQLAANPRYLTTNWSLLLRMYLGASHSTPYMRWRYKDITVLRFFDYHVWNEKEVEATIKKNLKWKKSSEVASSWRFDCRLDYVRRLMYASTVGVTELRDLFSKMIREKQMTREEALERLKQEEIVSKAVVEDVLGSIGLKLSDLNLKISEDLFISN